MAAAGILPYESHFGIDLRPSTSTHEVTPMSTFIVACCMMPTQKYPGAVDHLVQYRLRQVGSDVSPRKRSVKGQSVPALGLHSYRLVQLLLISIWSHGII